MQNESYQRLSLKTFFILLAQSSFTAFTITIIWFVLLILRGSNIDFLSNLSQSDEISLLATKILDLGIVLGLFVVLLAWAIAIVGTLIRHLTFYYKMDENGITIKQGLIHIREIATPYRHVENIDINQTLLYQLLGVCSIHILTNEVGGDIKRHHSAEIKFPPIEKKLADEMKEKIFSHIRVHMVNPNEMGFDSIKI